MSAKTSPVLVEIKTEVTTDDIQVIQIAPRHRIHLRWSRLMPIALAIRMTRVSILQIIIGELSATFHSPFSFNSNN